MKNTIQAVSEPTRDYLAVGVAATVPGVAWLAEINEYLTAISLLLAIAIAAGRIVIHFRAKKKPIRQGKNPHRRP